MEELSLEKYFNLKEIPFKTTVDEKYYFQSIQHSSAFNKIKYLIDRMGGLSVLIGNPGMGKSMLARKLIMDLDPKEYEVGLLIVIHTGIPGIWITRQIAKLMGVNINKLENPNDPITIVTELYKKLIEHNQNGKKPVILIDEANMLTKKDQMEELRGLTNLEINGQKLINIVLLGIPELEDNLKLDPPLAQRVTVKITLGPLQKSEIKTYIQHRLRVAGATIDFFDGSVYDMIYEKTKGIPRLINTLCYNAMVACVDLNAGKITKDIIEAVAKTNLNFL